MYEVRHMPKTAVAQAMEAHAARMRDGLSLWDLIEPDQLSVSQDANTEYKALLVAQAMVDHDYTHEVRVYEYTEDRYRNRDTVRTGVVYADSDRIEWF
jgi:hypothetical protein